MMVDVIDKVCTNGTNKNDTKISISEAYEYDHEKIEAQDVDITEVDILETVEIFDDLINEDRMKWNDLEKRKALRHLNTLCTAVKRLNRESD